MREPPLSFSLHYAWCLLCFISVGHCWKSTNCVQIAHRECRRALYVETHTCHSLGNAHYTFWRFVGVTDPPLGSTPNRTKDTVIRHWQIQTGGVGRCRWAYSQNLFGFRFFVRYFAILNKLSNKCVKFFCGETAYFHEFLDAAGGGFSPDAPWIRQWIQCFKKGTVYKIVRSKVHRQIFFGHDVFDYEYLGNSKAP